MGGKNVGRLKRLNVKLTNFHLLEIGWNLPVV
jgi:hypothetical protein